MLKLFFEKCGCAIDADFERLKERDIEPMMNALSRLRPSKRERIDTNLRDVYELACEGGTKALIEASRLQGEDFTGKSADQDGPYYTSMWFLLKNPSVFKTAKLLYQTDHLSSGSWHKRKNLPTIDLSVDQETTKCLERRLSSYYRQTEIRGDRCTVEYLLRHETDHYFFA